MTVSGQALADSGISYISQLDLALIEVVSDGENYTSVPGSSPAIKGKMKMFLNAHKYGRVKSWALWPSIQADDTPKKQYQNFKYSKSYPIGDRPKKVERELPFAIYVQAYKTYAKDACNQMASRLRNEQGYSNEEIFSVDRVLSVKVRAEVSWEMSGAANDDPPPVQVDGGTPGANPLIKPVSINCKKAPPIPPAVTGSAVVVQGYDPINFAGKCQMKLNGSIISNVPGVDVTFRYVDGTGKESDLKSVTTNANRSATFEHKYPLGPGHKTGKVRIVGQNFNFTSNWKDYDFECGAEPTNDLQTFLPPKATLLQVGAMAPEFQYKGHICPVKAKMIGGYKGRGKVSGKAVLAAKGQPKVMKSYSIEDSQTKYIDGEFVLPWQSVQGSLQQTVNFELIILNAQGAQVDYMKKSVNFACTKTAAVGKLGVGGVTPPPTQPTGKTVATQAKQKIVILAPRNRIRNGKIRLSGAKPDQVHSLVFLRKTKNGYKLHTSAQLPQQMTGAKGSFNLNALSGGDWQLRVCPPGGNGQFTGPQQCKHANFYLPKKTKPLGKVKTPGKPGPGPGPKPKVYKIVPGAGS
ncbi:hypothetical protein [Denitrobaculum tricleocarpae]|uniref:Uncharacterized protein n=1 Tax=Denitrobaculum tricleocarpae TaxID=2591009 RepID=A0A545U2V8_9PROT|nr:hypothetical protein [Denitrobaculum tricleocarpae]TQV83812.1 hypothetical protein FKG95_04325 [Denitrobaculum tricleocarpae]